LTVFVNDTTMAFVEDRTLVVPRQFDMENSGCLQSAIAMILTKTAREGERRAWPTSTLGNKH